MTNEKLDRRVRYTKMVLRESLLELMQTQPINKITVKDICERADVNRGTFYAHYQDPYDLLLQIENDLIEKIRDTMMRHSGAGMLTNTHGVIYEIVQCIADNADLCLILLGGHGHSSFMEKIVTMAKEQFILVWINMLGIRSADEIEYLYTFIVTGSIGVIRQWMEGGMRETVEEIATVVDRMAYRGLGAYMPPAKKA